MREGFLDSILGVFQRKKNPFIHGRHGGAGLLCSLYWLQLGGPKSSTGVAFFVEIKGL